MSGSQPAAQPSAGAQPHGDLAHRPATELAQAIRSGELGALELLEHLLARLEAHNPRINAVVTLAADAARAAARAADERQARGEPLGALHGLPVTIKDALETAGIRSTGGAKQLADYVPERDAPAVGALKAAGAVVFGKTNLPTWSGDGQTYNDLFGVTNNPWDLTRTPGGSSGGAAAAVAAGLTSFELGTDIGGSVRMPSHFCGVWGHKPSFGLVPGLGYLDHPLGGTMEADNNVLGPMGRSAEDLELLLGVLAGPTPDRAKAWRVELPAPRGEKTSDYRVAAWLDDPTCPIDAEMREILERACDAFAAAGAKVDRAARPEGVGFTDTTLAHMALISTATTLSLSEARFAGMCEVADGRAPAEPEVVEATARQTQRHREWLLQHRRREAARAAWEAFFRDYDVLLCPVTVGPAFPHTTDGGWLQRRLHVNGQERPYLDLIRWTCFIGGAYLPVTTPPLGRTKAGLPVSVQVVAPYLEDRTAIDAARRLADAAGTGFTPPPGF
ncbi:MAG: amidase [Acidimicrobiales bacterium]